MRTIASRSSSLRFFSRLITGMYLVTCFRESLEVIEKQSKKANRSRKIFPPNTNTNTNTKKIKKSACTYICYCFQLLFFFTCSCIVSSSNGVGSRMSKVTPIRFLSTSKNNVFSEWSSTRKKLPPRKKLLRRLRMASYFRPDTPRLIRSQRVVFPTPSWPMTATMSFRKFTGMFAYFKHCSRASWQMSESRSDLIRRAAGAILPFCSNQASAGQVDNMEEGDSCERWSTASSKNICQPSNKDDVSRTQQNNSGEKIH